MSAHNCSRKLEGHVVHIKKKNVVDRVKRWTILYSQSEDSIDPDTRRQTFEAPRCQDKMGNRRDSRLA